MSFLTVIAAAQLVASLFVAILVFAGLLALVGSVLFYLGGRI